MKKYILYTFLIVSELTLAQTGIDTNFPNATLDVRSTPSDNTKVDGLIAPKLTGDELKLKDDLYLSDQIGAIVYITIPASTTSDKTVNITSSGYYYFDGSIWVGLKGEDGTTIPNYNDGISRIALAIVNRSNSGGSNASVYSNFSFPESGRIDTNLITKSTNTSFKIEKSGYYSFSFYGTLLSGQNAGGTGIVRIRVNRNGTNSYPGNTSIGYGNGSANMYLGLSIVLLLEAGDIFTFQGFYTRNITIGPSNLGIVYLGE